MHLWRRHAARVMMVALLAMTSLGTMGLARRPVATSSSNPCVPAAAIPEPAGFVMFAIGAGVVGLALHRRSRKN